MAKVESGTIKKLADGRWMVKKQYRDLKGRRVCKKRTVEGSEAGAGRVMRAIEREIEDELAGKVAVGARGRTFKEIAAWCCENIFTSAEYAGLTKISGLRSWRSVHGYVAAMVEHFGPMEFNKIEAEDCLAYRKKRLAGVTRRGTRRSVASVNRELRYLSRMFKIGMGKRPAWCSSNPVTEGDSALIQISQETKKDRIVSFDEEARLMAAASGDPRRAGHLPFAIVMALETGMRRGEQFQLREHDLDLPGRVLTVTSYKGKLAKRRLVPITDLLGDQLAGFLGSRSAEDRVTGRVFSQKDLKRSFETCCKLAGLEGVTWHSLRHTAITRMVHVYGMDPLAVMKVVGHENWKTFWEVYVNVDEDLARGFADKLNAARSELARVAALVPAGSSPAPAAAGVFEESEAIN